MKYWCDPRLARAFFQEQKYHRRFSPMEGLENGTIFPELYCSYRDADGNHKSPDKEDRNNERYSKRKTD